MRTHSRRKRGEISTPIITILVTVAALAVTGVAISWMVSAGTSASSQGAAIIVGTPVIQGNTLYMTLKNIGNADTTITACRIGSNVNSSIIAPDTIVSGGSGVLAIAFNGPFTAGSTVKGVLQTNQGVLQFSAYVQ